MKTEKNERAGATPAVAQWREEIQKMKINYFIVVLLCLSLVVSAQAGGKKKNIEKAEFLWEKIGVNSTGRVPEVVLADQDLCSQLGLNGEIAELFEKKVRMEEGLKLAVKDGWKFQFMTEGPSDNPKVRENVRVRLAKFIKENGWSDQDVRKSVLYYVDYGGKRHYLLHVISCHNLLPGPSDSTRVELEALVRADEAAKSAAEKSILPEVPVEPQIEPEEQQVVSLISLKVAKGSTGSKLRQYFRGLPEWPIGTHFAVRFAGMMTPFHGLIDPVNGGTESLSFGKILFRAEEYDWYWGLELDVLQDVMRRRYARILGIPDDQNVANKIRPSLGTRVLLKNQNSFYGNVGVGQYLGAAELGLIFGFMLPSANQISLLGVQLGMDTRLNSPYGQRFSIDGHVQYRLWGNHLWQQRLGVEAGWVGVIRYTKENSPKRGLLKIGLQILNFRALHTHSNALITASAGVIGWQYKWDFYLSGNLDLVLIERAWAKVF